MNLSTIFNDSFFLKFFHVLFLKKQVVLILPGELSRHARDEGDKAVNKYISSQV